MGLIGFGHEVGLLAFLALVPLIVLYLIKPRPKLIKIPSLMFFLGQSGSSSRHSFLRKFVRDYLFVIQLLCLILLALAVAAPFLNLSQKLVAEHTVIILDVSASMQTKEGTYSRFEMAKSEAEDFLGGKNTIILAKNVPLVALESVSKTEALSYLKSLKPLDTDSKIGDAILLSSEVLAGSEGTVFVLSDFINTEGMDPETAKNVLKTKGVTAEFVPIGKNSRNVGIINLEVSDDSSIVYVKNFNDDKQDVTLKIGNFTKDLSIAGESVETFAFQTPRGVTKIEVKANDFLKTDNVGYISAPSGDKVKVLLITNSQSKFIEYALKSSDMVEVTRAEPPIVPMKDDFDVYISYGIDPDEILSGTFDDIGKKVKSGKGLVIVAQVEINELGYGKLLPVLHEGLGSGANVIVEQVTEFTKNIDFGFVNNYIKAKSKANTLSIAGFPNNYSAISFMKHGDGKVIFNGMMDDESDFKLSPSYPIFWVNLIKFLTDQKSIKSLNVQTGSTLILEDKTKISTPTGVQNTNALMYENVGLYTLPDRVVVANLLNDKESNIDIEQSKDIASNSRRGSLIDETVEYQIVNHILIALLILLFLEVLYVKFRGDL
ncbi:VWA domain-containing protein [Candidatus Woesearchaeota archaeon]|jgi:hypothetical protein|nr:VWA domain-containing protein [Candidatus Woesearchaeota archaeon]MBT3538162.1 VWA domain-containing protein [Candidatus Woesearchaeota archaeon]MBT4697479.1 VWA domain-containing protein [Candidatus Woesearchaeota archaeon]MBT4716877.1 VWA domain-containing protein [Candidatus Woesearchaeota archaeon]MBT7105831.1 VWA domain-containing protein [Candidatus Woesearchaeota archaeon]